MIPRKPVPGQESMPSPPPKAHSSSPADLKLLLLATTGLVVALVATLAWARRWLVSGCAIEALIIIYGAGIGTRIFSSIPLWTVLATLNLLYAISATSWLLYWCFTSLCYPAILFTCLFQFEFAANWARSILRKTLRELHFTRDRIALFNLPALEIDTDVDGLMAVRGVTISLSSLTIIAHGIELGIV